MSMQPDWLTWARKLQALAQTGLTYAQNPYDKERYRQLQNVAAEIFAAHTGQTVTTIEQWFAIQPGYATPKVDVRGGLLSRRQGPAGARKIGRCVVLARRLGRRRDVPSNAAEREVHEEAGFESVARKAIGIFDCNRTGGEPLAAHHAFKVIFLCEITGGRPNPDHEILEVDFFSRDDLPPLSMSRTSRACLLECFAHLDDPHRSTAFD